LSQSDSGGREERHIEAMTESLRRALEEGQPSHGLRQLAGAAMGDETGHRVEPSSASVLELFGAWHDAQGRYRAAPHGSPEAAQLLQDANQRWAAYEQAVNDADGGDSPG
jgi:hypothetical protein